jgi:hypothetical protein
VTRVMDLVTSKAMNQVEDQTVVEVQGMPCLYFCIFIFINPRLKVLVEFINKN